MPLKSETDRARALDEMSTKMSKANLKSKTSSLSTAQAKLALTNATATINTVGVATPSKPSSPASQDYSDGKLKY